jgi:tetratricopeptide (TPR) repeat protein
MRRKLRHGRRKALRRESPLAHAAKEPTHPPAHDAGHGEKPSGRFARLLAPLAALKKVGRLGSLLLAPLKIIPKGLGWAKAHKLVAVIALVAILGVGNGAAWWMLSDEPPPPPPPITIQDALKALDEGDYKKAREVAESLATVDPSDFETWGGVPFVLATADLYERDGQDSEPTLLVEAQITAMLQTARERGFPKGREAQGLYLLGRCLAKTGQYAAAREVLESALAVGAPPRAIRLPLAEAWSVDPKPDFAKAEAVLNEFLADEALTETERQFGMIELARQQLGQGDVEGARKTLTSFKPDVAAFTASQLMKGRLALAEARMFTVPAEGTEVPAKEEERKKLYQIAIGTLKQVAARDRSGLPWQRLSMYFIGAAHSEIGEVEAAIRQYTRLRQHFSSSYEALLAGLDQAKLLREQGKHDDAIGLMATVFRELPPSLDINHPHLPDLAPVARIRQNFDEYVAKQDYISAIKLLNAGQPALGEETTWELKASVYQQWGRSLLARAAQAPLEESELLASDGRHRMRQAGEAFEALSALHFSDRKYPEDIWNSAESYQIGRAYDAAAEQYHKYIEFNTPRRRAEALYGLAGSLLASGRLNEALAAVNEAIQNYPRNPGVYAARLLASRIYSELGQGAQAEAMLRANLDGGQLAPESNEWRDSLFALGTLLYREGRPGEALQRLAEGVRRWPDSLQAEEAHYLMAECNRQQAEQLLTAANATSVPSERSARMREVDTAIAAALENYDLVRERLEQRSDRELLPPIDQSTLRNCYFGRATMLQQLGRYEEALQAFSDASNRYQFAPEAMVAYTQAAECLRRMDRLEEARVALEQAKVALARIPAEADFQSTTNRSRAEWSADLEWMSGNL